MKRSIFQNESDEIKKLKSQLEEAIAEIRNLHGIISELRSIVTDQKREYRILKKQLAHRTNWHHHT
jgi:chromosome segregation ATPase